jgi:hypothetical protein
MRTCKNCLEMFPVDSRNPHQQFCTMRCSGAFRRFKPDLAPSEPLAYLVGVRYGDGNVSRNTFRVRVTSQAFAESCAAAMCAIGLRVTATVAPRPEPNCQPTWSAVANSATLTDWLRQLQIENLDQIFTNPDHRRAFLRGLYESEGHLSRMRANTLQLTVTSTNRPILELFQKWAAERGHAIRMRIQRTTRIGTIAYELRTSHGPTIAAFIDDIRPCTKVIEGQLLPPRYAMLTHEGKTLTLVQWAKMHGINSSTVHGRLNRGWSVERALTEPAHTRRS